MVWWTCRLTIVTGKYDTILLRIKCKYCMTYSQHLVCVTFWPPFVLFSICSKNSMSIQFHITLRTRAAQAREKSRFLFRAKLVNCAFLSRFIFDFIFHLLRSKEIAKKQPNKSIISLLVILFFSMHFFFLRLTDVWSFSVCSISGYLWQGRWRLLPFPMVEQEKASQGVRWILCYTCLGTLKG